METDLTLTEETGHTSPTRQRGSPARAGGEGIPRRSPRGRVGLVGAPSSGPGHKIPAGRHKKLSENGHNPLFFQGFRTPKPRSRIVSKSPPGRAVGHTNPKR